MSFISQYQIQETLHTGQKSCVYRATREGGDEFFVLKRLSGELPGPEELERFRREFEICRGLHCEGVPRALELLQDGQAPVIVFENSPGRSLRETVQGPLALLEFLQLAIRLTEILGEVHRHQVIHKDISPGNVLWHPATGEVRLIDFGLSTLLPRQRMDAQIPDALEGTLAYISPEQTGRINRTLDCRSDFYSLGALFYNLLTGTPPFESKDPAQLVYCHISRRPDAPHQRYPAVPETLSAIVMKLLEKSADDRYQGATGLLRDLEACRDCLLRTGRIEAFAPGLRDGSDRFQIPQKLYGREQDLATLLQAYEQVGNGFFELMLVQGEAGTGKTSLVEELRLPVLKNRGLFIQGNFDPLRRDQPYAGLIQAIESFTQQLLGESQQRLALWKEQVLGVLGANARVLIDLVPSLELLLGPQPEPPRLTGEEVARRFHLLFQQFFLCLPCAEHPLVLFLDNLQWADTATLKLLETLARTPEVRHLFILAACRDPEENGAHALNATLEEIRKHQGTLKSLRLAPLGRDSLLQLLSDTLKAPREAVKELAALCEKKTEGSPFFMHHFLSTLHKEGLIGFDTAQDSWHWDLRGIAAAEVTENVIDLMLYKVSHLQASSRRALQSASCFGGKFSLSGLSELLQRQEEAILGDLKEPLHSELIFLTRAHPSTRGSLTVFQFAHDRIQQACHKLLAPDERALTHLKIARLLRRKLATQPCEEGIFELVNQYNRGMEHISEASEREELCSLNLKAGYKAKQASAYAIALEYFRQGIALLPQDCWSSRYAPCLALHCEGAEAAYLCGETQTMEELARTALRHCRTEMDQVPVQETLIHSRLSSNDSQGALDIALPLLARLGLLFSPQPSLPKVLLSFARTRIALLGRSPESLTRQKPMTDPRLLAAMRIASSILSAAYITSPNLFPLIVFRQVQLSLAFGHAPQSAFAYANFGLILCGVFGDIHRGYAFGRLARNLVRDPACKEQKARVCFIVNAFIRHYREPLGATREDLLEARQSGLETGDFEFGTYATAVLGYHSYLRGTALSELAAEMERNARETLQLNQKISFNYQNVFRKALTHLCADTIPEELFTGDIFDRSLALRHEGGSSNRHLRACLHLLELQLHYLLGRLDEARRAADEARPYLDSILGFTLYPEFQFFDALVLFEFLPDAGPLERGQLLRRLDAIMKKLRTWSRHGQENYRAKYLLLRGEFARLKGRDRKAVVLYGLALDKARDAGQIQIQALCCRLTARFWQNLEKNDLAAHYLNQALYWYDKWGARTLVLHLQQRHSDLFRRLDVPMPRLGTEITCASSGSQALDYASILKASQVLSQEIVLENLLVRMMEIVLENAGADRGLFILKSDGQLHVEAEAGYAPGGPRVGGHIPVRDEYRLPHSILNYALRTDQPLVVEHACRQGPFVFDPRVQADQTCSVFCLPLQHKGRRMGALYLENSLTPGTFTPRRTELMRVLSSEMVISIENAKLYQHLEQTNLELEQKISERTDALRQVNVELRHKNEKIDSLLSNILPRRIVNHLKETGRSAPEHFEHVAVFFSDIVNFTPKVSELSPQLVIDELNDLFTSFDRIMALHNCERIKTIGDGYLAVCGIPDRVPQCASHLITAALDILDYLRERNSRRQLQWEVRIGIHCGSVVGGVIGVNKFIYDVFGDTINTASRMEQNSEPMQINVSESVVSCLKGRFVMRYRDELDIKGKGPVRMYFVERRLDAPLEEDFVHDRCQWSPDGPGLLHGDWVVPPAVSPELLLGPEQPGEDRAR